MIKKRYFRKNKNKGASLQNHNLAIQELGNLTTWQFNNLVI